MEADPKTMKRHVERLWPEPLDLFAASEQVTELVNHPGWECVRRVLEAEVAEIDRGVTHGREPKSQAEYAMAHGRRGGLVGMHDAALAVLAEAERVLTEQRKLYEDTAEPVSGR